MFVRHARRILHRASPCRDGASIVFSVGAGALAWRSMSPGTVCDSKGRTGDAQRGLRIVVIGGGVAGASTAYSLARRGHAVTVVDSFDPFRSSWGETRIARLSQETSMFLDLMRRARYLWTQLEEDVGALLLKPVGTLDIGKPEELRDTISTFEDGGVPYERLDAKQLGRRYPQVRLQDEQVAIFQKDGWVVLAEKCVEALTETAKRFGARVLQGQSLISCDTAKKVVVTDEDERLEYDKLIICCGPWTNQVLQRCGLPMLPVVVSCEQNVYFDALPGKEAEHSWDSMPILLSAGRGPGEDVYCIPHVTGGVNGIKIGVHREGNLIDNEEHPIPPGTSLARLPIPDKTLVSEFATEVHESMAAASKRWVSRHLPGVDAENIAHHYRCRYTSVAQDDGGFVVGPHPSHKDVILACAFHGEGFKFATAVGEMAADIALGLPTKVPQAATLFKPARLFQP